MKLPFKPAFAAILLMFSFATPVAAGPVEDGMAAYNSGDYATALRLWHPQGQHGNAIAQLLLGSMYTDGRGVKRDYAEATKWYTKAKEQGYADAQCVLARRCGTFPDYTGTMKWLHETADTGDVLVEFLLGSMYEMRIIVDRDHTEAVKWFRKAAEQGDAKAEFRLGLSYKFGLGVKRDYAEAVKWFRKAAEQGDPNGQDDLASMYESGDGVRQNNAEAAKWYRKAAEQGVPGAQSSLGLLYFSGEGVPQDYAQAYKWLYLAAERMPASSVVDMQWRDMIVETRGRVAAKMTRAQIAEAQKLAREWKPTTQPPQ